MKKWKSLEIALVAIPTIAVALPLLLRVGWINDFLKPVAELVQPRERARRNSCQGWQRQISLALLQYASTSDDKFPVAILGTKGTVGWADALQPWIKCVTCYQCPSDKTPININPTQRGYTDYWFNANLSGVSKTHITQPAATLLLGEGNDGMDKTDATYSKSALPASWLSNTNSPPWRHLNGANYAFVDGHVTWLKPDAVTSCFGRANCFAIK